MAALEVDLRRSLFDEPPLQLLEEHFEAPRGLDMLPGRMEPGELGIAQRVDGWPWPARAATRSATAFMPQLLRREDASAHRGD
jgi:hypothetical protein